MADAPLTLELAIDDPAWEADDGDWEARIHAAAAAAVAAARAVGALKPGAVEISALLTSDSEMRVLKGRHLGVDAPTNVLSFPAGNAPAIKGAPRFLGDIALGRGVCVAEATAAGKTLFDHVAHLVVHGTLHLLGYDHHNDADADAMEALEAKALASIGVADPYADDA